MWPSQRNHINLTNLNLSMTHFKHV